MIWEAAAVVNFFDMTIVAVGTTSAKLCITVSDRTRSWSNYE